MAWALVQETGAQVGNTSSAAQTFASDTVTGNAIVVLISTYAGNAAGLHANAVTDNKGNTYTRGAGIGKITENACAVYYCLNAAGGASHTVTFDPSDHASQFVSMQIEEHSGLATSGALDDSDTATGTTGNPTVALTTTVNDVLLIGLASHDASSNGNRTYGGGTGMTVTHNFGNGGSNPPILAQHKLAATAGSQTWDCTISTPSPAWMLAVIAIPVASAATTSLPPRRAGRNQQHLLVR